MGFFILLLLLVAIIVVGISTTKLDPRYDEPYDKAARERLFGPDGRGPYDY